MYSVDVFIVGTTTANSQVKPIGALDLIEPALIADKVNDLLGKWKGKIIINDPFVGRRET